MNNETLYFTCHKEIAYKGFIGAIFSVALVEMVGFYFFFKDWNTLVHVIHLSLSLLTFLFLCIDTKKVLNQPISFSNNTLFLNIGLRRKVEIHVDNIKEVKSGKMNYEEIKKNKNVLDLSLFVMEEPTLEITLIEPIVIKKKFGKVKNIEHVFFFVDEKEEINSLIEQKKDNKTN